MSRNAIRDMLLTARMQSRLAQAVYKGRDGVAQLAEETVGKFRWYESANVCAGALIFHDHVHLSVGGSNDSYDWAVNRASELAKVELLHAHKGYLDAAQWIGREIVRSEFPTLTSGRRLYLGGHSAGGAIAELLPIKNPLFRPEQIYTFGSPKWCSKLSASLYSAFAWETYRFVMPGDPVPYLPMNGWRQLIGIPGFAHTAMGLEVDDNGIVISTTGVALSARVLATIRHTLRYGVIGAMVALKRLPDYIKDNHGIDRYAKAIQKATERY